VTARLTGGPNNKHTAAAPPAVASAALMAAAWSVRAADCLLWRHWRMAAWRVYLAAGCITRGGRRQAGGVRPHSHLFIPLLPWHQQRLVLRSVLLAVLFEVTCCGVLCVLCYPCNPPRTTCPSSCVILSRSPAPTSCQRPSMNFSS